MTTLDADHITALLDDPDFGAGNFLPKLLQRWNGLREAAFLQLPEPYISLGGGEYQSMSLTDIDCVVCEWAAFYHAQGVRAKDVVGVYLDDVIDYFVQFIALSSLGAIPALVNSALDPNIAARYLRHLEVVNVYASPRHAQALAPAFEDVSFKTVVWVQGQVKACGEALPSNYPYRHAPADPVLLTHTSGTTGLPKAVQAAHLPFVQGVKYRLANPDPHISRYLVALPNSHNAAMAYLMEAAIRHVPCYVARHKDPAGLTGHIRDFRPDFVVAFPKQLVDLCRCSLDPTDFASVHYWRTTGDAVHERHVKIITKLGSHACREGILPSSRYIDGLGSSEMGSSLFTIVHDAESRDLNRCVGRPQPWVEARVLDDDGNFVGVGQVGRLAVKSPSLTTGYWNASGLTEKFRERGYWITGDLVYKDTLGRVFHVDRITDVIETHDGIVYSLLTEEFVMKRFDEIFECSVHALLGPSGETQAAISVEWAPDISSPPSSQEMLGRINTWLAEHAMPPLSHLSVQLGRASVPTGVTGKVLKRVLRAREIQAAPPHPSSASTVNARQP